MTLPPFYTLKPKTNILYVYFNTISLFFLLLSSPCLLAQEANLASIDKECELVKSKIQQGEFHVNEFKINSNRFSLHQPGYFQYFEKYFYMFDPRPDKKKALILKSVVLNVDKDGVNYYKEYVFDNESHLIFYFEQQKDSTNIPFNKQKIYVQNQKVIHIVQEGKAPDPNETHEAQIKQLLKTAQNLQEKFKEQFHSVQVD
jgi:hypothetical protein